MELIRPFEGLGKADTGIAGGKGASLGEMTSYFANATREAADKGIVRILERA